MAQADFDELPRKRWWIKPLIALGLLAVLGFGGVRAYRRFEPVRLAGEGRKYLAKGDYRGAVLSAQRALQINPMSDQAARLMVDIAQQMQSPAVVEWRRQISELNPGSTADALAWAQSALQMGKPTVAKRALEAVPEAERGTAAFHEKAALAALQSGDVGEAGANFTEAAKLEPANEVHQYNLATWQVQSRDAATRQTGAAALARLASGGRLQGYALRGLVTRFAREGKNAEALEHSVRLMKEPTVEFRDRLAHLDLLRRTGAAEFSSTLAETQAGAAAQADRVAMALNWMRMNNLSKEGAAWAAGLDAKVREDGGVALARAECLDVQKDWETLKAVTTDGNWGSREYLRQAWSARAHRELRNDALGNAGWQKALSGALRRRDDLQQLAVLAGRWGWKDELRETLWAAADSAAPQWALQILHRSYLSDGNTEGLRQVATRTLQIDPTSAAARNNLATLSLLRKVDMDKSLETARALHVAAPADASFASTYALALHLHGRSAEGLAVLRKLPATQLQEPSIAAYYGIILRATGAVDEARPFLELSKSASLLPEEKALLVGDAPPAA